MPTVELTTLEQVRELAESVLDPTRSDPIVCVTIRQHESRPLINAEALAEAVAPLEVHVLPTGELTWELTALIPEMLAVYGGAARIWWPGLRRADDPYQHPLIFCWSAAEARDAAERVLQELARRGHEVSSLREGPPQVAVARVPTGRPPWVKPSAADTLAPGDIVDAEVVHANAGGAEVTVAGLSGWVIRRRRMPMFSEGQTIPVRVVSVDQAHRKVELDPLAATAYQVAEEPASTEPTGDTENSATSGDGHTEVASLLASAQETVATLKSEADAVRRDLARELAEARARVIAFARSAADDIVVELERDLGEARDEASSLRRQLDQLTQDRLAAIQELRTQRERAQDATRQARSERARRKALEDQLHGRGVHDDREDQFRHEVQIAYDRITTKTDREQHPLSTYWIGSEFLDALESIQGVDRSRVVEFVARLVSGGRKLLPADSLRPLREDAGAESRQVMRQTAPKPSA